MSLNRLEPSVLVADQVFEAIHDAIMSGDLPAGHRLVIRDLAAELGTSVMPVREAIRRLEEAGLAEKAPYKGAVVKGLELDELLHVYDARRLLEVEGARLGAERATSAQVARMREEYDLMLGAIEDGGVADVLDHDEALLCTLYAASANPVLVDLIRGLWNRCRPYKIAGARTTLESGDTAALSAYQLGLIDAVARGDALEAARITRDSLLDATARIRTALPEGAPTA